MLQEATCLIILLKKNVVFFCVCTIAEINALLDLKLLQPIVTSFNLVNMQEYGQECILLDILTGKHTNGLV